MLGEVWISLQRSVLSCSRFSSFPPLSRVRVRAHHRDFVLFAFTTFTNFDVVYCYSVEYKGIRNGVLQTCTKARPVEAMKDIILEGERVWFVSHFYENSTPIGEGCESKKCMFAGNACAYARKLTLYFFYLEWVACTGEGSSAFLIIFITLNAAFF